MSVFSSLQVIFCAYLLWCFFFTNYRQFYQFIQVVFYSKLPCLLSIFIQNFDVIVEYKNNLHWKVILLPPLAKARAYSKLHEVYQGQIEFWINPRTEIPQLHWENCSFLTMFTVKKTPLIKLEFSLLQHVSFNCASLRTIWLYLNKIFILLSKSLIKIISRTWFIPNPSETSLEIFF